MKKNPVGFVYIYMIQFGFTTSFGGEGGGSDIISEAGVDIYAYLSSSFALNVVGVC